MRDDFERRILLNESLGAILAWQFAAEHVQRSVEGDAPSLPAFLIAVPLTLHGPTVRKIKTMRFDSGLIRAVSDEPELTLSAQAWIEALAPISLRSLQVASSAGLLAREEVAGFPTYRPVRDRLPAEVSADGSEVRDMLAAARRLGAWMAQEGVAATCWHLRIGI
ncbi:three component ABC system middle component [Methylorubrum populi]|uniref:three component ABC system middle component n=1 Tax=Methylorubrum populi TaxID=223967 RepID=UPI0012FFB3FC|nr:three component ABC system middle component [Methylorubrum populi]